MRRVLTSMIALGVGLSAFAQPPEPDPATIAAKRQAVERLSFLVGEWEGEGWISRGPGTRQAFTSWELVQPKLDGTVLLVEGLHKNAEGEVVHDALAVISWDTENDRYRFSSYTAAGGGTEGRGWIEEGAFVWTPGDSGTRKIRFTLRLDEEGRWVEDGKITLDGERWHPFFEMRLDKVGDGSKAR